MVGIGVLFRPSSTHTTHVRHLSALETGTYDIRTVYMYRYVDRLAVGFSIVFILGQIHTIPTRTIHIFSFASQLPIPDLQMPAAVLDPDESQVNQTKPNTGTT